MTPSPLSHAPIPWHRRLEARMLLSATLVAGLSLVALLFATREVVVRSSLDRAARDLAAARDAFTALVQQRVRFAEQSTRQITEQPSFRTTLEDPGAGRDSKTLTALASYYCQQLGASLCVTADAHGDWLGQYGLPAGTDAAPALTSLLAEARRGRPATDLITVDNGLYLVVSEPALFAQEVLGTFTSAYVLDDAVARELSRITRCDVGFVCGGTRLCGTSLQGRARAAFAEALSGDAVRLGDVNAPPGLRTFGETSYVAGLYPLASPVRRGSQEPPRLALLDDWTPAERAVARVNTVMISTGLITFVFMVAGALIFGRRMTRPFRTLAAVSHEIAGGLWNRRAPLDGPAEARLTAAAFNHMTDTLGHWHREATEQARRLNESNTQFRAVTDSVNDAIVSVNDRDQIVFWNQRAHVAFGYTEADALTRTLAMLIAPRYRDWYKVEAARLRDGSLTGPETVELSMLRQDGVELPVELSLSTWKGGRDVYVTAVFRDITERRRAAETLRDREDQLRQAQKMEAVGQLAGGIAHDFNNLLTSIMGYADLLLEDLPADHPNRADVAGIRKAGQTAAILTRDLLAFSRKQVLQPVVLDLNGVVVGTESLLRPLLGEDIHLEMCLDAGLPPVTVDRVQMEQVLLNLAANARDAMPRGGGLTIATSAGGAPPASPMTRRAPERGYVVLSVSDTGHGMTAEVRARIFEPFFTTKELGKGTGLGLATVYGIVQQSGGVVWVDSEPEEGATFHVALPAAPADAVRSAADAIDRTAAEHGSETVLLVEDNESVRELAASALRRHGYDVLEARNGVEALGLASGHADIAVLLTDVVMPQMGGHELAARLSALRGGQLRVIYMSGYTHGTGVPEELPGTAFLQKPFTPSALGHAVRDLLDTPLAGALSAQA